MRLTLTPRRVYFDLLTELGDHLVTGADILAQLIGSEPAERPALANRMRDVEHLADESTHAIIRHLNRSSATPFDRDDLYDLTSSMDDCMDSMEEATDAVVLYRIGELPEAVTDQVATLQRAAELTAAAMPQLRKMNGLEAYWIEVNRLENQADRIYRGLTADLFTDPQYLESPAGVVHLIKIRTVVDSLEAAADHFEKVANIVESIYLKES